MKLFSLSIKQLQKNNYARVARVKVIIQKDYADLVKDEITKVRAGFMRNDLYPNGIAQYATKENLKKFEERLTV